MARGSCLNLRLPGFRICATANCLRRCLNFPCWFQREPTVDGRNPAPPEKPWNDDLLRKYQQTMVSHIFKVVRDGFRNHPQYHWTYVLMFSRGRLSANGRPVAQVVELPRSSGPQEVSGALAFRWI